MCEAVASSGYAAFLQVMTTPERHVADIAAIGEGTEDTDDIFRALSNPRRRFVIACLDTNPRPLSMAELAVELASWECDTPRNDLSDEQVSSRTIVLHHMHVPMLASLDIVDHDRESDTVVLADQYEGISAHAAFSAE